MGRIVLEFRDSYFYPRPPRGGRPCPQYQKYKQELFLSTPSARRATEPVGFIDPDNKISIHALREEGDWHQYGASVHQSISIHALREEGDKRASSKSWRIVNFYPRPPRGGRPHDLPRYLPAVPISIHALREEGDPAVDARPVHPAGISIHALREEGDF